MKVFDIDNREVEVGDLVLIAKQGCLHKRFVLGFTNKHIIFSCARGTGRWELVGNKYVFKVDEYNSNSKILWSQDRDYNTHNGKMYSYPNNLYILEKNCEIPENLRKFIKY